MCGVEDMLIQLTTAIAYLGALVFPQSAGIGFSVAIVPLVVLPDFIKLIGMSIVFVFAADVLFSICKCLGIKLFEEKKTISGRVLSTQRKSSWGKVMTTRSRRTLTKNKINVCCLFFFSKNFESVHPKAQTIDGENSWWDFLVPNAGKEALSPQSLSHNVTRTLKCFVFFCDECTPAMRERERDRHLRSGHSLSINTRFVGETEDGYLHHATESGTFVWG